MTDQPSPHTTPPNLMGPPRRLKGRQNGLTLTELLVAAALTGVAITGAVAMANLTGNSQREQIASTQDRAAIARVGEVLLKKADGMTFIGVTADSSSTNATLAYVDTGRSMRGRINQVTGKYVITVPQNTITKSEEGRDELIAAVNRTGQVTMLRVISTANMPGGTQLVMRPPVGTDTCAPDLTNDSTLYPMSTVSLGLNTDAGVITEARDFPETNAEKAISQSDIARGSSDMKLTYIYSGPNNNALLATPTGSRYTSGGVTLGLSGINVMVRTRNSESAQAISSHVPLEATGQISLDANGNCSVIQSSAPPTPGTVPTADRKVLIEEHGLPIGSLQARLDYQGNTQATRTSVSFRDSTVANVPDDSSQITLTAYPVRYTTADGATIVYTPKLSTVIGVGPASGTATTPATLTVPATAGTTVNLTYTVIKASVTFRYPQDLDTLRNSKLGGWAFASLTGPVNDPNYQSDTQAFASATSARTDLTPGTYQLVMPQVRIADGRQISLRSDPYGPKGATLPVYTGASYLTPFEMDITKTEGGVSTLVYTGTPGNLQKMVFSSAEGSNEPRYTVTYRYRRVSTNGRKAGETCYYDIKTNNASMSVTPAQQNWNAWVNQYQTSWFYQRSYLGDPWIRPNAPDRPTGRYYPGSTGAASQSANAIYDVCVQLNLNHMAGDRQTLQIPENGSVVGGVNITDTLNQANSFLGDTIARNYANYVSRVMPGGNTTSLYVCASSESAMSGDRFSWNTIPVSSCTKDTPNRLMFEVTLARRALEATQLSDYTVDSVGISNSVFYSNFYGTIDAPLLSNDSGTAYYRNTMLSNLGFTRKTGYSWTNSSAAWHWNIVRDANKFIYNRSYRSGMDWRTCKGSFCGADTLWNDRWADPEYNNPNYVERDNEIVGSRFYADDNWGGCNLNGNACDLRNDGYTPNYVYSNKEFILKPGTRLLSVSGYHKLYGYWMENTNGYWGISTGNTPLPDSYLVNNYPPANTIVGP